MAWSVAQLQHNASMLYNHLCSYDANQVYVDAEGHLQLDNRPWLSRVFCTPLGDYSRDATDAVAIRTLRRVLNAVEEGTLDPNRIVIRERVPIGLFMSRREVVDSGEASLSDQATPDWLNRDRFGRDMCNANQFVVPYDVTFVLSAPRVLDDQLPRVELVHRKIVVLAQQIIHGKENYQSSRRDDPNFNFYDVSDDES